MPIKVVEYVHEYDDKSVDYNPDTKKYDIEYVAKNRETYYAIGEVELWNTTDSKGDWEPPDKQAYFKIQGTDLHICNREELLGYLGLLNKLLEEFPQDGE